MKKAFILLFSAVALLLLAALLIPYIYKDDIKARIDKEIAAKVNAKVFFSADKFGLTVFKNFPDITVNLDDFGVVGKGVFEGDTLVSVQKFSLVLDIMSVIKGDQIGVKQVLLEGPRINAKRLKNGQANWDIAVPDTAKPTAQASEPSKFSVKVKRWEIKNGQVIYADNMLPAFVVLHNLNHSGSGDFTQDLVDLSVNTTIESVTAEYGGTAYLSNKKVESVMNLGLNMPAQTYTLKDNSLKINTFACSFGGVVTLKGDDIITDVTFKTTDAGIKGLLSLVPGVFKQGFEEVKTDGNLSFSGFAKGTYNSTGLPAFGLNLKVDKGMVQYPKLPSAVTNIDLDLAISNLTGKLENTVTDLRRFHMDLGKNPIDARLKVTGLTAYTLNGMVKASLNLGELSKAFPVNGLTLNGLFAIDASAQGRYDTAQKLMPSVKATASMVEGMVKTDAFPEPLEKINFSLSAENPTGLLKDTKIHIENYSMVLAGEPFSLNAYIENLDDYLYDVKMKGIIDLAKITKIYPVAGTEVSGLLTADIATKGRMSYVTAKKYNLLPTSGTASLANFTYKSTDLAHEVKIASAALSFDPQHITLTNFTGTLGKSPVQMTGKMTNYMGYVLSNATLTGNLNMTSPEFDSNEWMSSEPATSGAASAETPMQVIAVPANLNLVFSAKMDKLLYSNLSLQNFAGNIVVNNGTVKMDKVNFGVLDGTVALNGTYDPRVMSRPLFNFDMDMKNINAKQAYASFNTIQKLAPAAKNLEGSFSTRFALNGPLTQQMMPDYPGLNGGGVISLTGASLKNLEMINGLNKITHLNLPADVNLKDVVIKATVVNGRANFAPFTINAGGNQVTLSGSQGFDGTIDYLAKMNVPAGIAGAALNNALAALSGTKATGNQNVKLNVKITGTNASPKYALAGTDAATTDNVAKSAVNGAIDQAKKEAQAKLDAAKADAEAKAKVEADRLKKQAEDQAKAEQEKLKQQAKDKAADALKDAKKKLGF